MSRNKSYRPLYCFTCQLEQDRLEWKRHFIGLHQGHQLGYLLEDGEGILWKPH